MPSRNTLLIMAAVVVAYFLFWREDAPAAPAPDVGTRPAVAPTPKKRAAYKPPAQGTTAVTVLPSQADREAAALAAFKQDEGWAN